jgi:putative peptidoglycan lipid II flippase
MSGHVTRGVATMAAGILASRLLGFIRDILLAHLLGAAADPFLVAFRLPNFLRRLLAEGSLGMAHAAAAARALHAWGADAALALSRGVCLRLFLCALGLALFLGLAAFPASVLLAPGLPGPALEKSALLLRLCLPYLPLCAASAIAFAHAAALDNLAPQASASFCLNSVIVLAAGAALLLPPQAAVTVAGVTLSGVELLLCAGVVCGGLAQAALGARCLRRHVVGMFPEVPERGREFPPHPHGGNAPPALPALPERTASPGSAAPDGQGRNAFAARGGTTGAFPLRAQVTALLRHLPASALGAAPQQLHSLAGGILASFLAPGGISAVYFAERLVELPLGLAGVAVGLGALPRLTSQAARLDRASFTRTLTDALRLSAFLSLPAAAGLCALSTPLAGMFFGHGASGQEQTVATAAALRMYALGLPAMCASRLFLAAAPALGMEREPLRAACVSLIIMTVAGLAGMALADGSSAAIVAGLAAGMSIGAWSNAFLLSLFLRARGIARIGRSCAGVLAVYALAALLVAGLLTLVGACCGPWSTGRLLAAAFLCPGIWVAGFYAAGSREARAVFAALAGRARAGATGAAL